MIKAQVNLKGKAGFDDFCEECDEANPPKDAQMSKLRCTKDEMGETFPLVNHGLGRILWSLETRTIGDESS